MPFDWSDDRNKRLRELIESGASFGDAARELGCSRNAVIGKAHRLGLQQPVRETTFGKRLVQAAKEAVAFARGEEVACRVTFARGDGVALLDLEAHHCRYPSDDGLFCGKPRVRKAYCAYHAKICYELSSRGLEDEDRM